MQSPRPVFRRGHLLAAYYPVPINTFGLVYEEASVPSTLANKCADFSSVRALLSEKFPFPILSFRSAPISLNPIFADHPVVLTRFQSAFLGSTYQCSRSQRLAARRRTRRRP